MKRTFILLSCVFLSSAASANIVVINKKLFVTNDGKKNPIMMVNNWASEGKISKIKLYREGTVNLVSFAKEDEKEKLYSVDSNGFIYSIEPFASYSVKTVDAHGRVEFKEVPYRKYSVNSKGFFLY